MPRPGSMSCSDATHRYAVLLAGTPADRIGRGPRLIILDPGALMSTTQPASLEASTHLPSPDLVAASIGLIRRHQHPSGAYPASPTFSAYAGYSWFRDGAFIADGMRRAGAADSAAAFHGWCTDVLLARTSTIENLVYRGRSGERVLDSELLPTRYTVDGRDGDDPWWDFQLDGYGTWLWALAAHVREHGMPGPEASAAVRLVLAYLTTFWHRPCYDWWEEHPQHRHVSTLAAIRAGLHAVLAEPLLSACLDTTSRQNAKGAVDQIDALVLTDGVVDGHLVKWVGSTAVDASLAACLVPFDLPVSADVRHRTIAVVERDLAVDHGVHRYLGDTFYGGGQWLLLSAFVGWNHLAAGDLDTARGYLRWIEGQVNPDLQLPEQVPHHLLAVERRQEWLDRWGPVASPLLWSHAMYLTLAAEIAAVTNPQEIS
jgi:GH15 family glucan-1,4-alpha-glucosidase